MPLRGGISINKADLRNLNKKFKALEDVPNVTSKVIKHEANQAVAKMRKDAPVDTGRLRRNIEIVKQTHNDVVIVSEAIDPETGVDYAPIQEYGLGGLRPRPFFRENIQRMFSKIRDRLTREINKIINK